MLKSESKRHTSGVLGRVQVVLAYLASCAIIGATASQPGVASWNGTARKCSNGSQLAAALADPTVPIIVLKRSFQIQESDWSGYQTPVLMQRNCTISARPDARPVSLDMNFVRAKVRLADGITLTFDSIVFINFRSGAPVEALGFDIFAPSLPNATSMVVLRNSTQIYRTCFPVGVSQQLIAIFPARPSQLPGRQNIIIPYTREPPPGKSCTNHSYTPLVDRCYAYSFLCVDWGISGTEVHPNSSIPVANGIIFHSVNTMVMCMREMDDECVYSLGYPKCTTTTLDRLPPVQLPTDEPSPPPDAEAHPSSAPERQQQQTAAIIAGSVVGGLAVLAVITAFWILTLRRRHMKHTHGKGASSQPAGGPNVPDDETVELSVGRSGRNHWDTSTGTNSSASKLDAQATKVVVSCSTKEGMSTTEEGSTTQLDVTEPQFDPVEAQEGPKAPVLSAAGGVITLATPHRSDLQLDVSMMVAKPGGPAAVPPPKVDQGGRPVGVDLTPRQQQLAGDGDNVSAAVFFPRGQVRTEEVQGGSPPPAPGEDGRASLPGVNPAGAPVPPAGGGGDDGDAGPAGQQAVAARGRADGGDNVVTLSPLLLGKGGFGRVYEGTYRGATVAVKVILDTDISAAAAAGPSTAGGLMALSMYGSAPRTESVHAADDGPLPNRELGPGTSAKGANSQHQEPPIAEGQQQKDACNAPTEQSHRMLGQFAQEVEVLGRCHHPNVVRLLAACLTPPRLCLVMERMETSLERLVFGRQPADLMPLDKVLHIAVQICEALEYLHPTIIHRDLKPANVLINFAASAKPVAKVTDFGLARLRVATLLTAHPDAGTPGYQAPECFDAASQGAMTHHADMYSLGVLMWVLLTGQTPWKGFSIVAIAYKVAVLRERLPLHQINHRRCPPALSDFIWQCWEHDPLRRPAAAEAVKTLRGLQQKHEPQRVEVPTDSTISIAPLSGMNDDTRQSSTTCGLDLVFL